MSQVTALQQTKGCEHTNTHTLRTLRTHADTKKTAARAQTGRETLPATKTGSQGPFIFLDDSVYT